MSTQVAKLCARCHRWRLEWLGNFVRDALGYRYWVCMDCPDKGDRR